MLQSKQRLLELNTKLAETLTSKGVTATADETTTSLINKVSDISSGGDDSLLKGLIQRDVTELEIPYGVTSIGLCAFYGCSSLTSITIPNSVTSIGLSTFFGCSSLTSITIPNGVTSIGENVFQGCLKLTSITIPNSVTSIDRNAFRSCSSLTSITIPNSVTSIGMSAFYGCVKLTSITIPSSITSLTNTAFGNCIAIKDVALGKGFNANNLDLSASALIERETIVDCFNAFADRTGLTAYNFTINKVVGDKLTDEDRAIATAKNWTIVEKEV